MRSPEQISTKKVEHGAILEADSSVAYLGVALEKAKNSSSQFVPRKKDYKDFINDNEVALPLQRDIAISFLNGDPLLVEGGTSLGKTTTVKKMAADLGYEVHYANLNGATDVEDLMGRYIPNPHRNRENAEDPEFLFADGKITSGLRKEEGKVKVIILDEFNAAAPNILIRLHEVLDALERGSDVILSEDASEAVGTDKTMTKIVALMNPPGKGYHGREPIDPAQLRRWVYKKLPSDLPGGTFSHATDSLFGIEKVLPTITDSERIVARDHVLSPEQLQEIPGLQEILEKYKEFHKGAKALIHNRKIAEDQPQQFTYDDRMEPRRVRDFVLRFYNGDINETFQKALRYYYSNKLETDIDRKKLEELIMMVEAIPRVVDSKRKGLDEERMPPEKAKLIAEIEALEKETKAMMKASKKEKRATPHTGEVTTELAERILGKDFLGPTKIEKTFGITIAPEDIPEIPYSKEQLDQAKERGEMLVLGVDKDNAGKNLTMEHMLAMIPDVVDPATGGKVKLLYAQERAGVKKVKDDTWHKNEPMFTGVGKEGKPLLDARPRFGWRLTGKTCLSKSVTTSYGGTAPSALNYIEHTKLLRDDLVSVGSLDEVDFRECSDAALNEIAEIMKRDVPEATRRLANLGINVKHRRLPVEVLYDILLCIKGNNERILERTADWSSCVSSDGYLVSVGDAGAGGAFVRRWGPGDRRGALGVVAVR